MNKQVMNANNKSKSIDFTDYGTVKYRLLEENEVPITQFFNIFHNMIDSGEIISCSKDLENNRYMFKHEYYGEYSINLTNEQVKSIKNNTMDNVTKMIDMLYEEAKCKENIEKSKMESEIAKKKLEEEKQEIINQAKNGFIPDEYAKKLYEEYLTEEIKNTKVKINLKDMIEESCYNSSAGLRFITDIFEMFASILMMFLFHDYVILNIISLIYMLIFSIDTIEMTIRNWSDYLGGYYIGLFIPRLIIYTIKDIIEEKKNISKLKEIDEYKLEQLKNKTFNDNLIVEDEKQNQKIDTIEKSISDLLLRIYTNIEKMDDNKLNYCNKLKALIEKYKAEKEEYDDDKSVLKINNMYSIKHNYYAELSLLNIEIINKLQEEEKSKQMNETMNQIELDIDNQEKEMQAEKAYQRKFQK